MTVLIYVDTNKQIGDKDHLRVFATTDAAETWFEENDPEGVVFEYPVLATLQTFRTRFQNCPVSGKPGCSAAKRSSQWGIGCMVHQGPIKAL